MSDTTWYPRDSEAQSLAQQLRAQRLTLLFGETGSGKTTLIKSVLMPLLRRRPGEAMPAASKGVVLPFRDPRSSDPAQARLDLDDHALPFSPTQLGPDGEVVVFFDEWEGEPLEALLGRMRQVLSLPDDEGAKRRRSLASTLGSYHRQRGGTSIIILDKFEEFLVQSESLPGHLPFSDAFVDAMNRPGLPVHFLVSINEDAAPLLERYRGRIAGLDDHCMRLPPLRKPIEGPAPIPVLRQVPEGYQPPIDLELPTRQAPPAISPEAGRPTVPSQPDIPPEFATSRQPEWLDSAFGAPTNHMKTQDVYASMESLLGKIVQGTKEAEERVAQAAPVDPAVQDKPASDSDASAPTALAPDSTPSSPAASAVPLRPTNETTSQPPSAARATPGSRQPRPPSASPVQVWPPATVVAQPPAAPEFEPIVTFESAETFARLDSSEGLKQPLPPKPAAGPMVSDAGTANVDWLSEVHASLTKLSTTPDPAQDAPMTFEPYGGTGAPALPSDKPVSGYRVFAIIVIAAIVLILLAIGSTFLPAQYRPFDMPPELLNIFDKFNSAPTSNYTTQ